jgi:lipopolysaccharide-induced tumor necrosis factor-alpha factor
MPNKPIQWFKHHKSLQHSMFHVSYIQVSIKNLDHKLFTSRKYWMTNKKINNFSFVEPQPTTIVHHATYFGPDPVTTVCPSCRAHIRTQVNDEPSGKTHSIALCLFCFGCVFGCCLFPYCMSSCQKQKHKCPNCRSVIGYYNNYWFFWTQIRKNKIIIWNIEECVIKSQNNL